MNQKNARRPQERLPGRTIHRRHGRRTTTSASAKPHRQPAGSAAPLRFPRGVARVARRGARGAFRASFNDAQSAEVPFGACYHPENRCHALAGNARTNGDIFRYSLVARMTELANTASLAGVSRFGPVSIQNCSGFCRNALARGTYLCSVHV